VSEYDSAIIDIANFASDNILWIDPASNYAVYSAAGVNILATVHFGGPVQQSIRCACVGVCVRVCNFVRIITFE